MTRDDIIRMARETGFTIHTDDSIYMEMLHSFAALVAAAEREACAKVVIDMADNGYGVVDRITAAIRARSGA